MSSPQGTDRCPLRPRECSRHSHLADVEGAQTSPAFPGRLEGSRGSAPQPRVLADLRPRPPGSGESLAPGAPEQRSLLPPRRGSHLPPARAPCVRSSLSVLPPLPGSLQPRRPGPRGGRAARGGAGRGAAQLLPQVTMLRTRLLPAPAVRPARPFLLGYFPPPSRNARAAALTYTCAGPAGFGNRPRKLAWGWVVGHRG